MKQWKLLGAFVGVFLGAYFLPLSNSKVTVAIVEAFKMLQWYARNHTLACVVPALFIAGAIITFLSREAVLRHLGPQANKFWAYLVASVSGTALAVCSCSVLPMFAGIYGVGAGLGPASAFLYAGPAVNILAIFLTARVLGFEIGAVRNHHRADHGGGVPQRRAEADGGGCGFARHARTTPRDVADGALLRRDDGFSGLL